MEIVYQTINQLNKEFEKESKFYCAYEKLCGYLKLEDIFTTDSVYFSACKCACGFRNRNDTFQFMKSPWTNSYELCQKVLNGTFKPKYYRERKIIERGKERIIKPPVFECKVVQKVLSDYINRRMLEHRMITTNYASIKGRGPEKMYQDILNQLNRTLKTPNWKEKQIVMTDFSDYFASIDSEIVEDILRKYIQDPKIVNLALAFTDGKVGLSLGNETSQVPASFFPSSIDHRFKDQYRLPYFRFMDDTLFLADTLTDAKDKLQDFTDRADSIHLAIKPKKIKIVPLGQSFIFCKERFFFNQKEGVYYRMMNPQIARNERNKLKSFQKKRVQGQMSPSKIQTQYHGVRGMIASRPNTGKILKNLDESYSSAMGLSGKNQKKIQVILS